jgi:proline dehydrogenase
VPGRSLAAHPDAATRDALIRDKLRGGDWQAHLGKSPSLFVNAAAWGLVVTGKLVDTHSESGLLAALKRITARGGEPLVRKGVDMAMRLMGEQFVMGETISRLWSALASCRPEAFAIPTTCSARPHSPPRTRSATCSPM